MPQDITEKFKSVPQPKRRGRKRRALNDLQDLLVVIYYQRFLHRLQARKPRPSLPTSSPLDWRQGPPHERAARILARLLVGRNISHRSVLNIVSRNR